MNACWGSLSTAPSKDDKPLSIQCILCRIQACSWTESLRSRFGTCLKEHQNSAWYGRYFPSDRCWMRIRSPRRWTPKFRGCFLLYIKFMSLPDGEDLLHCEWFYFVFLYKIYSGWASFFSIVILNLMRVYSQRFWKNIIPFQTCRFISLSASLLKDWD